ncbi:PmoA family protein [Gimesia aquarii]|nr:PmoA family protein [Gimesia aquarii]
MKRFVPYFQRLILALTFPWIGMLSAIHAADPTIGQITLKSGKHAITDEPVFVLLPETGLPDANVYLVEKSSAGTKTIPAQIENRKNAANRLWFIPPGKTTADTSRVFEIKIGQTTFENDVSIKDSGEAFQMCIGNRRVLNYNYKHRAAPKLLHPLYGRSAHIHPIWTPSGKIVSDEFPPDHAHQSGQFLAYTNCLFEGRVTNFWEIKSNKGRVRFHKLVSQQSGPVFAELKVKQEHVDLTGSEEKAALLETWTIRVWNQTVKQPKFWMYDITSEARCASESPLLLPKYHYGGMAIRGGRGWDKNNCRFLTSNGKTRKDGNHDRAHWCDIYGRPTAETPWSGFTILSHRTNFRHPEPVRIHPSMPYMVFTPSALGDWKITPEQPNISRYRFLVHDGPTLPETEQIWQNYADPPQTTLQLVTENN